MPFSYPFLRRLGLGAHLAVIVALAAIPTSLLIIEFIDSERREAIEDAHTWARNAASQGAEHHRDAIATAEAVLQSTAARLDMGYARTMPCMVPSGLTQVIWFMTPGGAMACSTEPEFPLPQPIVDGVLSETTKAGFAVVGPFKVGPNKMAVFGAMTRVTADGVRWRILLPIDLEWVPAKYDDLTDPRHLVVMALDEKGQIFDRSGPNGGPDLGSDPSVQFAMPIQPAADGNTPIMIDVDGVRRIFGAEKLSESGITVVVGVSHEAVLTKARNELLGSLALLGAALTLSGLIAWLILERMVLRSVRKLRDAAVATARGEKTPRVEIADGPVELQQLADAFNEMTGKLEFQALHDQLTGLGNRRYIQNRLVQILANKKPFAVLAIDLDGFKPINDTYGHGVGDFVLAEAAARLTAGLGDGLFIGRTGGDEFLAAILVDGGEPAEIASATARRMLDQLARPITLADDTQVTIGGSVGIAFWPGNGETADEVVREADLALYRAKNSGRNRFVVPDQTKHPTQAA